MEKQKNLRGNIDEENTNMQKISAVENTGKVDMTRSIAEDPGYGEGDRTDTTEMENLGN